MLGGATTIDTRGAEAVWTAITRSSSPAAAAGWEAHKEQDKADRGGRDQPECATSVTRPGQRRPPSSHCNFRRIDWSPASNQSELRVKRRVVHKVARERHLSVVTLPGHDEPCCGAVCPIDQNLVATLQRPSREKTAGAFQRTCPRMTAGPTCPGRGPPSHHPATLGSKFTSMLLSRCQPEVLQPRVHLDCGDPQPYRQSGLAVRSGRAVRRQAGVRRQARCRGCCSGRRRRHVTGAGGRAAAEHEQGKQVALRRPGGQTRLRARHPPVKAAIAPTPVPAPPFGLPAATVSPIAVAA